MKIIEIIIFMSILPFVPAVLGGVDIILSGFIGIYLLISSILIWGLVITTMCKSGLGFVRSKKYQWHLIIAKGILFIILLIISYIKMLTLGDSDSSLWKWFSAAIAICAVISLLMSEIMYLKQIFSKMSPNKANSFDISPRKNLWVHPKEKASTIEIKHTEKKLDTEKENLI